MRTAAGVLLIVTAVINLGAGVSYGFLGGMAGALGSVGEQVSSSAEEEATTEEESEAASQAKEASGLVKMFGGAIVVFGIALLALAGCEIAAAVFLFSAKKAMFIMVVAGIEIAASLLTGIQVGGWIFPGVGIVSAVLAILAAQEIGKAGGNEPQPEGA